MFRIKLVQMAPMSFTMNDPKPRDITAIEPVTFFSADGADLAMLRDQFDNVPMSMFDSCTWAGEMASFVYRNLRTIPEQEGETKNER